MRDLMPSYNPGLVTGGVTKPPDLSKNIAHKLTFVKSSLAQQLFRRKKGSGFPCGLKAKELREYVSSALGHPIHKYYTIHRGFVKLKTTEILYAF